MNFWEILCYGLIQGLTEFFPVSSSGHLALLPHFLNISDPGVLFDLSMHGGTVLAVIIYFRKDFGELLRKPTSPYLMHLGAATVTTFGLVLLIKQTASDYGRMPWLIAVNLVVFGIVLFVADKFSRRDRELSYKSAVLIGLLQAIAVFPGVSRSGATLLMGRFMGLPRESAARFSFLLSVPVIIGGILFKLPRFFEENLAFELTSCLLGVAISFVVGLCAIHFFLRIFVRTGIGIFCLYRIALAGFILYYL